MAAIKVLIADDEVRMRRLISDFLKREGYHVIEAEDGKAALEQFSQHDFGLVILDVMMPEYDGWVVCKEIRKNSQIPIIMLTARSEEADEIFGFDIGADEYITKPFSPMILVARVQALLRRLGKNTGKAAEDFSGLEIDEIGHVVRIDREKVELSPKEFELLIYITKNRGIALSREQILNSVWDYDYLGDERTVDTHIKKLRLKLGNKGDFIQTVRGTGYRFEVER